VYFTYNLLQGVKFTPQNGNPLNTNESKSKKVEATNRGRR
jgi:hypothetical protein